MSYKSRIETLQETHKYLDRQCTDIEKKLTRPMGELRTLKKKKLAVRDQIKHIQLQIAEEEV
jgi:hypothetical protein